MFSTFQGYSMHAALGCQAGTFYARPLSTVRMGDGVDGGHPGDMLPWPFEQPRPLADLGPELKNDFVHDLATGGCGWGMCRGCLCSSKHTVWASPAGRLPGCA